MDTQKNLNLKPWWWDYPWYLILDTRDIKRVQKAAFMIIMGTNYIDYEVSCTLMGVEPLAIRRETLCLKFAEKDVKNDNSLFLKSEVNTRNKNLVVEPKCNTKRFRNSSIPYLSRLLNNPPWCPVISNTKYSSIHNCFIFTARQPRI